MRLWGVSSGRWRGCFSERLIYFSFFLPLDVFMTHRTAVSILGPQRKVKKKNCRDWTEAMKPQSHWINHLWCHTILGPLLLSQSILCLSLHETDFLLPVAKSTLNYIPQGEDDKRGVNLLIVHSVTAPSVSESKYLQTLKNSRVSRSIFIGQHHP